MVVNGQPKGTAEYIQATSRVGRFFPGLVCTVLTWARPRDLSHYETFEHYHATFYKHVEAQSVTPFSPRAMDRGLTGTLAQRHAAGKSGFQSESRRRRAGQARSSGSRRGEGLARRPRLGDFARGRSSAISLSSELKERLDEWAHEAGKGGRTLAYEKKGPNRDTTVALLKRPGIQAWDNFTVPMSMREVEPGVGLIMSTVKFSGSDPGLDATALPTPTTPEVMHDRRKNSCRRSAPQPAPLDLRSGCSGRSSRACRS